MNFNFKNHYLLGLALAFLVLICSGLILWTQFHISESESVLGLEKSFWINLHAWSSVATLLFLVYHLIERWSWIKNFIFKIPQKQTRKIKLLKRNSIALSMFFFISLSSGYIAWLSDADCIFCEASHDKSGLILIILIGFHIIRNKYLNPRFFNFKNR